MKWRDYLLLAGLGLLVFIPVALLQSAPGYMDADYYYLGGLQIASGQGLQDSVLWNYLDDPAGLPHPSHGYWMPLASFIAAIGIRLTNSEVFFWARLPFVVAAALVPAISASLSFRLSGSRIAGLVSGILACLPGFYLPFLTISDTFALYMVLGGSFFLIVEAGGKPSAGRWHALALGLVAGLMHLARADGVLWLGIGALAIIGNEIRREGSEPGTRPLLNARLWISSTMVFMVGYLVVMGPWLARNVQAFGTPLAPGGSRALWLTEYDQLFAYPAESLSPETWRQKGLSALIGDRLWALRLNLANAAVVQGFVVLWPLMLAGLWRRRQKLSPVLGALAWVLTLFVMTIVFPFPGARGGFFHSGAALQPLFWASVPAGLAGFVAWGQRTRGWIARQATFAFGAGLVLVSLGLTVVAVQRRVIGDPSGPVQWGQSAIHYEEIETALEQVGILHGEIVMVNNPPGYYLATGRPAIVIPNVNAEVLREVAERYDARYVLLEVNHPRPLDALYDDPESAPDYRVLTEVGETVILRVEWP